MDSTNQLLNRQVARLVILHALLMREGDKFITRETSKELMQDVNMLAKDFLETDPDRIWVKEGPPLNT